MEFTNLEQLWTWIIGGGSMIIVNWFVSWALEELSWWAGLASKIKSLIILALSGAIAFVAQFFLSHPEVLAEYAQYILLVVGFLTSWLTTQIAHNSNPSRVE